MASLGRTTIEISARQREREEKVKVKSVRGQMESGKIDLNLEDTEKNRTSRTMRVIKGIRDKDTLISVPAKWLSKR